MKRSGSGRVARKVGSFDDEEDSGASSEQNETTKPSVVKRPALGRIKKRSSLRISFGPGDDATDETESSDAASVTPRKSSLSRIALEKSAQLRARSPLVPEAASRSSEDGRPSYSKDYIAKLRSSTPSTPQDLQMSAEEQEENRALDIATKFGPAPVFTSETFAIPTDAEIKEKKARRRRLAQEGEALNDDEDRPWASDDEGEDEFRQRRNVISVRPKDKYGETRLVRDDEDIAEGFDEFVDDGRISLGRKSEREAQRKKRAEMAALINDAEGSDDDSSDDSDEERNAAFAAAQAHAGRYGQKMEDEDDGAKTPPRMAPLPDLDEILQGLSVEIARKQQRKEAILQKKQELDEDETRIRASKKYLQEQLQKTGEEYEKLRLEAGLPALPANAMQGGRLLIEGGLDTLGTTPLAGRPREVSDDEE